VAGEGPDGAAQVGAILRGRRRARGLSLEEVERTIRFSARHIRAVEEGRFERLPPQPYGRGLIRAYALLVGVEPEQLLRAAGDALDGEGAGRRRIFRTPLRERATWREWTVPFALALAVATLLLVQGALRPPPPTLEEPQEAPAVVARPVQPPAAPADLMPAAGPAEQEPASAPGVRVLLRSAGTTWVEAAADAAGARRYDLGPGQNLELTARERLTLSLGDAGVVRLRVGERELGFIGYKGESKTGLTFSAPKGGGAAAGRPADGD
jgi:transcriptional regulator with XRE-family HTH domain